jgi:uncharacterized protein YkwD
MRYTVGMRKLLFAIAIAASLPFGAAAAPAPDTLVKASGPAVYYFATDGKRYAFPNARTYASWFTDFSGVKTISDTELAAMPLGGNVTYRPGIRMVKIQSDPKVYAVDRNGTLRWVTTETIAEDLYGQYWNTAIDDVSDAFFASYRVGSPVATLGDFNPFVASEATDTIAADKGITVGPSPYRSDTEVANVVDEWRAIALKDLNALRAQNGKAPLVMSPLLNRIATIHSRDMALHLRTLEHDGSLGEIPDNRIRDGKVPNRDATAFMTVAAPTNVDWTSENVGMRYGYGEGPEQHIPALHAMFMDEPNDVPNHRTTMLSVLRPYAVVGIGPYLGADGKFWLTEDFISLQ